MVTGGVSVSFLSLSRLFGLPSFFTLIPDRHNTIIGANLSKAMGALVYPSTCTPLTRYISRQDFRQQGDEIADVGAGCCWKDKWVIYCLKARHFGQLTVCLAEQQFSTS